MLSGASPTSLGSGKPWPVGSTPARCGARSRIGELARDARLHQSELSARHAFAIERHAGLQRMRDIVGELDVIAEQLLADAIGEETAAIGDGGGAEIAEHLAHQIEDGGGLQNHGVAAGRDFMRVARQTRFFSGASGPARADRWIAAIQRKPWPSRSYRRPSR